MKTVKHEIKLERSVKIILCILAVGVLLNAFATPIGQELFATKDANAEVAGMDWSELRNDPDFELAVKKVVHRHCYPQKRMIWCTR